MSALSAAMSERDSVDRMDVDSPAPNGGDPSSPTQQQQQEEQQPPRQPSPEPAPAAPTAPVTNGAATPVQEDVPVPPPHKSDPNSPPPTPADEAEVFKNLGNKFFKEKNFGRAIDEYTKGRLRLWRRNLYNLLIMRLH